MECSTKKKIYDTYEIAEEALVEAWIRYDYPVGAGPVAVYRCEDCGYYHFTSKGEMNQKLSTFINSGKLKKQKSANEWTDKMNRKR